MAQAIAAGAPERPAAADPGAAEGERAALAAHDGAEQNEALLHDASERLRRRLEADPEDDQVALELALTLEQLGADLELYALLSARLEDSEVPLPALAALLRGVLVRLRDGALQRGAQEEAWLYASALARVVG